MCAWQVQVQEREVACVYKEEYSASTNRGTSKMLAPARGILNHDQIEKSAETYYLEVVDIYGGKVLSSHISDGRLTLDVSYLRPGQYRVVIFTSGHPISATLNISR
jgi:hypothetical protein